jgi:hypothetical protein
MTESFTTSLVECNICTHRWVAVRPIDVSELECPNCSYMTFIEGGDK